MGKVRDFLSDVVRQSDLVLLALCVTSTLYGMVLIASATHFRGTLKYVAIQGLGLMIGVLLYFFLSAVDVGELSKKWKWLLAFDFGFILLLRTPFGLTRNGNRAWLGVNDIGERLGVGVLANFPITVQPAEIVKITFIILLARQLALLAEKSLEGADRILGACARLGLRLLTMQDADYPVRLRNIFEPPCLLYVKGSLPTIDEEVAVAMVGTRRASPYGIETAEKLAYGLCRQGAVVISGAAAGVDSASHRGALRAGGRTIAVLGNGLDIVYPAENEWLYRDIAASGALISEYPPGTAAEAWHFPARNRIISALSLGTIVVEAPEKSGALITANTALEQGRDVFAVPGPIDAPLSRGCNRLIADGAAGLITDSWDVLREYEAIYPHKILGERVELPRTLGYQAREEQARAKQAAAEEILSLPTLNLKTNDAGLTDDQIAILRTLKDGALQVDDLIEKTQIPTRRVLSALTMMELEGYVEQGSGKHFSLTVTLLEE